MHELAIAEGVIETVTGRLPGAKVSRVILRIGALTCVEPEAMRFCFDAAAQGTALEGAVLEIVEVPARGSCRTCGAADVAVDPRIPLCPCGSADLDLTDGEQLLVSAVEVA
ncbi:MAG: hydrogenase maturation nickel metallochaperone HypA [Anaeromyxobacteraceae bacterium]